MSEFDEDELSPSPGGRSRGGVAGSDQRSLEEEDLFANNNNHEDWETEVDEDEEASHLALQQLNAPQPHSDAHPWYYWCCGCCLRALEDGEDGEDAFGSSRSLPRIRKYKGFPESLKSPLTTATGGRTTRSSSEVSSSYNVNTSTLSLGGTEVSRRIMLLGTRYSGKTSLVRRAAQDLFETEYLPTYETVVRCRIPIQDVTFVCDLIDTGGQMEDTVVGMGNSSSVLVRHAMLGVHGYLLVFSLSSLQSFHQLERIYSSLVDLIGMAASKCVLVGTKSDCPVQRREVPFEMADDLAYEWGIPYVECSSRTGLGVLDTFETLLLEIDGGELLLPPPLLNGSVVSRTPTPPPLVSEAEHAPSGTGTGNTCALS